MNFVKCGECGKQIPNDLKECPNCGCPVDKKGRIRKEKANRKKGKTAILVIVILLLIAAAVTVFILYKKKLVFHKHIWVEATCEESRYCSDCGKIDGAPLGHDWKEATCEEGKKCSRCGLTVSEPLGHSWIEATCTEPKKCERCGITEGEALGHKWKSATCLEPKTCTVCGLTEGTVGTHTYKAADCEHPKTCTTCGKTEGKALGHTTDAGKCEKCGKIINKPVIDEIWVKLIDIAYQMQEIGNNSLDGANTLDKYIAYCNAYYASHFDLIAADAKDIYDFCGDYIGLMTVKSKAKAVADSNPGKIYIHSVNAVDEWFEKMKIFFDLIKDLNTEINKLPLSQ